MNGQWNIMAAESHCSLRPHGMLSVGKNSVARRRKQKKPRSRCDGAICRPASSLCSRGCGEGGAGVVNIKLLLVIWQAWLWKSVFSNYYFSLYEIRVQFCWNLKVRLIDDTLLYYHRVIIILPTLDFYRTTFYIIENNQLKIILIR